MLIKVSANSSSSLQNIVIIYKELDLVLQLIITKF